MRLIRKTVVLALAGLGMYKVWEIANEKFGEVRQRASDAKARIEPALRETEDTVQGAADDVSASVHNLSHTVADTLASPAPDSPPAPLRSTP